MNEITHADFSKEKQLAGAFMGRPIKNSAGKLTDLSLFWQNPQFKNVPELPFLSPNVLPVHLEGIGLGLPALFWQKLQSDGSVIWDLTVERSRFEMQVVAMQEYYLLTLQRIITEAACERQHNTVLHKTFFEYADVGIVFMDTNALIKEVNPALEKMTGYRADELVNTVTGAALRVSEIHQRQMNELLPFIKNKNLTGEAIILAYLQENGILKRENTLLRKDGTHLPVLSTTTKAYNEAGKCLGYINFSVDISELKQTQSRLDRTNQRLKLATQAGHIGMWEYNILTDEYYWDEETYKIHGVLPETKTTGDFFLSLVHPEDKDYLLSNYTKQDGPDFNLEPIRIQSPDGRLRYIKCIGRKLYDAQKNLTGVIGVVSDVTESYLAQLSLSESEKRYRFLVNNLKEVIFQTDLHGNLTYLNPSWKQLTGFEIEDTLGTDCMEFIHPEDRQQNSKRLSELVNEQTSEVHHEIRHLTKGGTYRWIEMFACLTFDEDNQPNGSIGTLYDISGRKQMEESLADSEKRFKAIFNSTFQFMALTDSNGNVLEMNDTVVESRGIIRHEAIGKPFWEVAPTEKYITPQQVLKGYFQEAAIEKSIRNEIEILDKNEQPMVIDFSIKPLRNEGGKVNLLLIEGRNITDRKRAQNALLESEQRFRDIAENVDEIFWSRAANSTTFLYVNPAYERITGKTCQSLYDDPGSFLEVVAEEDRAGLLALFSHEISDNYAINFRVKVRDGTFHWFAARVFVIRDAQGKVIRRVGVAGDISLQKERELLLTQSLEKEKELNLFKSQFVSHVSHEFRTPLAIVQSSIELLKHYFFNTNDHNAPSKYASKINHHFSIIDNKIRFFNELLTDMLTLQQIEIGKISFQPQATDLVVFVIDFLNEFFGERPDKRRVEFRMEGLPRTVSIDEKLMTRVLINLISNAFKFSKTDPELRLLFRDKEVKIEIIDHGIGIPAEDIPRLFSTFFRAGNVGKINGTGLGLQISKQLVELHSGCITVNSRQNEGTTMTIIMPLTPIKL
ncbi:PAS domain S-box protein [Runella sp.]|uniref:sensor histidine kinase n=1 Tax=Runella sp. TaxID=1960881 RepID=UPI003D0D9463